MTTAEEVERIARVCHEANRAWCQVHEDDSQAPWGLAPEWQKKSACDGVAGILSNPLMTPEHNHEQWMRHKENDGWTYGAVKDAAKKEHPQMVPYDALPPEQRVKDELFVSIVKALMAA